MTSSNIDIFNEAVARILARLWDTHPIPYVFDNQGIEKAFPDLDADKRKVYWHTAEWLALEGFITREEKEVLFAGRLSGKQIGKSMLTLKGITILGQTFPPNSGEDSTKSVSAGEKLLGYVSSGAMDIARELVKELILSGARQYLGM